MGKIQATRREGFAALISECTGREIKFAQRVVLTPVLVTFLTKYFLFEFNGLYDLTVNFNRVPKGIQQYSATVFYSHEKKCDCGSDCYILPSKLFE
jgi:hypothetical protein